jgi:hypothetical protein
MNKKKLKYIYFLELDKMYSREEYQSLHDIIPFGYTFREALNDFLKTNKMYRKWGIKLIVYNSISGYLSKTHYRLFKAIFRISLREVPLFMNEGGIVAFAVQWRFIIGK